MGIQYINDDSNGDNAEDNHEHNNNDISNNGSDNDNEILSSTTSTKEIIQVSCAWRIGLEIINNITKP